MALLIPDEKDDLFFHQVLTEPYSTHSIRSFVPRISKQQLSYFKASRMEPKLLAWAGRMQPKLLALARRMHLAAHLKDVKQINERTHPAKYKLAASTATFNHDFTRTESLTESLKGSFEKLLTATLLASFRASPTQTLDATYGSSSSELRNMPSLIRILLQKQT